MVGVGVKVSVGVGVIVGVGVGVIVGVGVGVMDGVGVGVIDGVGVGVGVDDGACCPLIVKPSTFVQRIEQFVVLPLHFFQRCSHA